MLHIEKYAAIDIGSNAVRLLITTVIERKGSETQFKKTSLVRVPIRLGADVFTKGEISKKNYLRMVDTLKAFALIMKTHNVARYRACATSAVREATNGAATVQKLYDRTGIQTHIIDGKDEAAIIASTDLNELIKGHKAFLFVDVGGGSTELTVFAQGKTVVSRSFKLGTVRILNDMVRKSVWDDLKLWVRQNTRSFEKINCIGSGGNINSIYKHSGTKIGKPLSYFYMANYYEKLRGMTYHDRIFELRMNPDRADVIVPATKIYLSAMKWGKAKNMYVPRMGLADGIVKSLYNERKLAETEQQ
ncbi:MAG: Ppx/GppA phosphatase family protein [Marinirhabdus sp.]